MAALEGTAEEHASALEDAVQQATISTTPTEGVTETRPDDDGTPGGDGGGDGGGGGGDGDVDADAGGAGIAVGGNASDGGTDSADADPVPVVAATVG